MLTFSVGYDLYIAGYTEDGYPYTAERYFVAATDDNGNRWIHSSQHDGCRVEQDEEGMDRFIDIRDEAKAHCERLVARINAVGGVINLDHWTETRPEYGSIAYQQYGQHADYIAERMESANY